MKNLKYFLASFTVFVFVQTLWQYWFGSFFIIGVILLSFGILALIKKSSRGLFIFVFLGIVVGGGSVFFYDYRNSDISENSESRNKATDYMGTGEVVNFQGAGKYIYDDGDFLWIVKEEKLSLSLGEQILLVGYKKEIYFENLSGFILPSLLAGEFDYNKWLYMKGYRGVIQGKQVINIHDTENRKKLFDPILFMRKWMFSRIEKNFGIEKSAGLLRGLLLGDRSGIPKKQYQTFIDSGLVHIVAVSGGNMIMLILLLHALLFFLPYYIRLGAILCLLIFYGFLCGLDSSVLRALLMGGLTMFALFSGRIVSIRRLMSYAWIVMLLLNPYVLLYDMGFLLSFFALIGIVLFQKATYTRGKNWRHFPKQVLQKYLLPTLGANLGVFPILVRFTGTMNITSLLGNMIVIPFVPFMMLGGMIGSLFGPYLSWIPFIFVEKWLLNTVYFIASWSARVGWYLYVESMIVRLLLFLVVLFLYRAIGKVFEKNKEILDKINM